MSTARHGPLVAALVLALLVPLVVAGCTAPVVECRGCAGWAPTRFEQRWALYFTLGLTGTTR